ncbi:hypothetical protein DACRYDRAFT_111278 [Dacryopinax primogenitus]|uniref:SH3 domain-binding glutamic acid-rich protein n=1 Tax=Dacryopinax primogenitus (strain DJM 731) TaxID=1858805 RepID=M5FWH9_DACPD|nr:uncharacterized protein DACRYDRAFT_111278 [Dacryopinax primogenitus]EJT97761.1 hypothetical protein DACRYDRAFT_111278 [Dacryopinax primogenitus]
MSPPIQVFLTTITMQPVLRQRQEYLLRILQTRKVPFTSYDVASDENAKRLWRRKAPQGKQDLPGILIGGSFSGTFQDFEEAVEFAELDQFLRLNEPWNEELEFELNPRLPQQAIGVPGAHVPSLTQPLSSSTSKSPASSTRKPRKTDDLEQELDSLNATDDQISDLLESLGLENEGASERPGGIASVNTPERGQQKGFGALGGEAARAAREKAQSRLVSSAGTAALAVKPLALRKASGVPAERIPDQAPVIEDKKPEPTPSSDVDPEGQPVKGEGEVTTAKATEDELVPSGFEGKELQNA